MHKTTKLWLDTVKDCWAKFHKRYPRFVVIVKIALIFVLLWMYTWKKLDPDFGWHLRSGDYIRQHWIPAHDIYTYTAKNFSWIDHEWGNDVFVSFFYGLGGFWLLTTIFAGLWTLALSINGKVRLSILVVSVLAVLPNAGIRPTVWTVLALAILLRLITSKSKYTKASIPLLFLAWANLHGGFIIGLAIITYCGVKDRRFQWLYILIFSVLATFVNPYGPRLYVEVARTLFDPALHSQINEWRAFYIPRISWEFVILWATGFWLFDHRKLSGWLGLTPILFAASLSATRNIPLFVVAGLRDIDGYSRSIVLPKKLDGPRKLMIGIFIAVALAWTSYGLWVSYLPWSNREAASPNQAITYLQSHRCSGQLFNGYEYGGYLIWKLPQQPVYIDGRMPSWHDSSGESYIERYMNILKQSSASKSEFAKYNIRCALLFTSPRDARLVNDLRHSGWKTAVNSSNGTLLLIAP